MGKVLDFNSRCENKVRFFLPEFEENKNCPMWGQFFGQALTIKGLAIGACDFVDERI